MSDKAVNVYRKTWTKTKEIQKTWRTIAQDHLTKLQETLAPSK